MKIVGGKNSGTVDIHILLVFLLVFVLGYLAYARIVKSPVTTNTEIAQQTTTPFTFTAAGDFSSSDKASAVLYGIAQANSDFTLALGDLGYAGNGTEASWCDFVRTRIGENHPFELIAGNHDDGSSDGDIAEYAKCMPDKIGNLVGNYATEYYFDYGNLARFIMISPDINNYGFDYTNDSKNLQWVIDAVNSARAEGTKWIVLGMHKNCITPGLKSCEIGEDLLNTAVGLKIDIVLQGHEHAYFRSKQLALNKDTCPAIIVNEYNETCVNQAGDELTKGQGSVIVISGAGGKTLREVKLDDKEIDYFAAVNGTNSGGSYGFSLFEVSNSQLKASFVPSVGDFTDSFTIR